jgi:hypothetical protein
MMKAPTIVPQDYRYRYSQQDSLAQCEKIPFELDDRRSAGDDQGYPPVDGEAFQGPISVILPAWIMRGRCQFNSNSP